MSIANAIKDLLVEYKADSASVTIDIEHGLTIYVWPDEERGETVPTFRGDSLADKIATQILGAEAPAGEREFGMFSYLLKQIPR